MKTVKIVAVCMLFFVAGVFYCSKAHAILFCYDGHSQTGMEWLNGTFTYTNGGDKIEPPAGLDIDPSGAADPWGSVYCYANSAELLYVYENFPDLSYPKVTVARGGTPTFRASIQPWNKGNTTVYWTGDQAVFLWNHL